jgi:hypothetical protein
MGQLGRSWLSRVVNWVGYPGFGIPGSDRGQSARRASKGEWEALVHPLARRALSRS